MFGDVADIGDPLGGSGLLVRFTTRQSAEMVRDVYLMLI